MTSSPKPLGRTRLSREQRYGDILVAARKVFEEKGYEDTTIAEIAHSIGVVDSTVIHYFGSKRSLMDSVIESFYREITSEMEQGVAAVEGTRNRLFFIIRQHLSLLFRESRLCAVIIDESRDSGKELRQTIREMNRRYTGVVTSVVLDCQAAGEIPESVSPMLVRNVVFGAMEHYLWDILRGAVKDDATAIARQLTDLVLGGICQAPAAGEQEIRQAIMKLNKLIE